MAKIIIPIKVDVANKNVFPAIVAKQNDTDSRFLKVTFTNNGAAMVIAKNSSATINARRADDVSKSFAGEVDSDGAVTVPLARWMLELDDTVKCDISVIDSEGRKLTSTLFYVEVEEAANDDGVISEDDEDYDIALDLQARMSSAEESLVKTISSENTLAFNAEGKLVYSNSVSSFSAGDLVTLAPDATTFIIGENTTLVGGAFAGHTKVEKVYVYSNEQYESIPDTALRDEAEVVMINSPDYLNILVKMVSNGTITDEQISSALEAYLEDNPIEGVGEKGQDGDSAYQVAVNNGYEGSEAEWLESLKGTNGKDGTDGNDGVSVTNAYILSSEYGSEAGKLVIEFSNDEALILDKVVGEDGKDGEQGIQGETADISAVNARVDDLDTRLSAFEEISSKLQTVSSVDEMIDTSQQYILESTGTIWEYGETEVDDTDRNLFDASAVSLNQNPDGTTRNGAFLTDYIPVDVSYADPYNMRIVGLYITGGGNPDLYKAVYYDANKTELGTVYGNAISNAQNVEKNYTYKIGYNASDVKQPYYDSIAYVKLLVRVSTSTITQDDIPTDLVITTPEPKTKTERGWNDTGVVEDGGSYNLGTMALSIKENSDTIKSIDSRLGTAEKTIASESSVPLIPDYWKEEVDSKEATIRELQNNAGADVFQFVWFSDLHGANGHNNNGDTTKGKSETIYVGAVAQYAIEKYNIPLVAASGDIMSQSSHTTEDAVWNEYEAIKTILSPIDTNKFICTKGNHDGAWGEAVDGVYYLNNIGNKKTYNTIYRKQATDRQRVFGGDGTYFYVDCPQKVRFIMLNSHTDGDGSNNADGTATYNSFKNFVFGQEQLDWLVNVALDVPKDYSIIIMAHAHLEEIKDGVLLCGIINAYNNKITYTGNVAIDSDYWGDEVTDSTYKNIAVDVDFTSAKGEILPYFHGHNHKDRDYTYNSVKCIAITTAGGDIRDTEPEPRVGGTATESAIDIVTIDRSARKIYCTRLGAGADRNEIAY